MENLLTRFPLLQGHRSVACWLRFNLDKELSQHTLLKYSYGLADYLQFCQTLSIDHLRVTPEHVQRYKRSLQVQPWRRGYLTGQGLKETTIRQRLEVVQLYYTYLKDERIVDIMPFRSRRLKYNPDRLYASAAPYADVDEDYWIPSEPEWLAIVTKMADSPRNLLMLMLTYEGALRRQELCSLQLRDLDQNRRLVTVRKETTKNQLRRTVPYSLQTQELLAQYLASQPRPLEPQDPIFRSESPRNAGKAITYWTWNKVVRSAGLRVGLPEFSPHTIRHLRITHWAEAGLQLPVIAKLAGHKSWQTTMRYIHIRQEHLAEKMVEFMTGIYDKFISPTRSSSL